MHVILTAIQLKVPRHPTFGVFEHIDQHCTSTQGSGKAALSPT
jgi:hypothetical protein